MLRISPEPPPQALAVTDVEAIDDCHLCIRGEHHNRGGKVPRGVPAVFSEAVEFPSDQSGRLQLAQWIASPRHPLTARVFVNRVWMHLMGQGIVRSVDNFGVQGDRPSHPKLLDELASRFASPATSGGLGWSVKSLVRLLVLSRSYRLSSDDDEINARLDPENRLHWRANRRRLQAEEIRDSLLAATGALDLTADASPVKGLGVLVNNNNADAKPFQADGAIKRSLYLPIIRSALPAELTVFDFADPDLVVGRRPITNVPAQALLLMNSPFVMDCAERTAEKIASQHAQNSALAGAQSRAEWLVRQVYLTVLSRLPQPIEVQRALAFLQETRQDESGGRAMSRWSRPWDN